MEQQQGGAERKEDEWPRRWTEIKSKCNACMHAHDHDTTQDYKSDVMICLQAAACLTSCKDDDGWTHGSNNNLCICMHASCHTTCLKTTERKKNTQHVESESVIYRAYDTALM